MFNTTKWVFMLNQTRIQLNKIQKTVLIKINSTQVIHSTVMLTLALY